MAYDNKKSSVNQKESHIPILSPKHFSRAGSLKLKNECRPRFSNSDNKPGFTISSPISTKNNLRRHRSLQGLNGSLLHSPVDSLDRDDADSEKSFGSSCNSICGSSHSPFAHNGTTYSSRHMKYIFHCSTNTGSEEYLTPTQRANRSIKRLRHLLSEAQSKLFEKENEIARLTMELMELRMQKMDEKTSATDGSFGIIDQCNNDTLHQQQHSVIIHHHNDNHNNSRFMDVLHEESDMYNQSKSDTGVSSTNISDDTNNRGPLIHQNQDSPSLTDSGNFEDMNYLLHNIAKMKNDRDDLREKHNEKVEQLLKIIADTNDKYYDLKPKFDALEMNMKILQKENAELKKQLSEQEDIQKALYLQLYTKTDEPITGKVLPQSNEKGARNMPLPTSSSKIDDLTEQLLTAKADLEQLKIANQTLAETNNEKSSSSDPEITLRFLKSAVYYFLTDPCNARDHLSAIESILGYSQVEKKNIEKMHPY